MLLVEELAHCFDEPPDIGGRHLQHVRGLLVCVAPEECDLPPDLVDVATACLTLLEDERDSREA